MKAVIAFTLAALAAGLSVPGIAAGENDGHGAMSSHDMKMPAPAGAAMVDGTVKKVDKAAGKVTLSHGPLTNLGMNMSMTMAFGVKDAAWLTQMREGDKIRFVADNVNGVLTVVKFESVK